MAGWLAHIQLDEKIFQLNKTIMDVCEKALSAAK
jgi:hypothetical protein